MTATKRPQLGLMVCAVLALSACGGGSEVAEVQAAPPATADAVPDLAMASSQSFVDFQKGLAASDTIEPLSLQKLLPPLSDTAEPITIGGG